MSIDYIPVRIALRIFILSFLLGVHINGFTQSATISGHVTDARTLKPLPFATVFINNTTIGGATDEQGYFKLSDVPIGKNYLVISFIGYLTYQTEVKLVDGQQLVVNAPLVTDEKMLDMVAVHGKHDK